MKTFRFNLETLLQHRRNLEDRERMKFSRIRADLLAEVAHMQTLRNDHEQARSELVVKKSDDCDWQEIMWYYRYLYRLDRAMELSTKRIAELEKQAESQKQVMIEASRDKKMMENLRDKKEKEFITSAEREEQKSVDEMVVIRFTLEQG